MPKSNTDVINPYEPPRELPAEPSRGRIPLKLMVSLVAVILLTPLAVVVAGVISQVGAAMFLKVATKGIPTTDPVLILGVCLIFFGPPFAAFCGMICWIQRIVHAIRDARRQSNAEAHEKTPAFAEV